MFLGNAKYEWNDSIWLNADLPVLTSLTSLKWSFEYPRTVILKGNLYFEYCQHLVIPNLQIVNLPNYDDTPTFGYVTSKRIYSCGWFLNMKYRCFFHSRWSCLNRKENVCDW